MDTTATTGSSLTQALLNSVNGTGPKASSVAKATQDQFLKLLTTQLQNQDPLNPMDNSQMTSQLAQISAVDGITQLNATLQQLVASSANSDAVQAAALVGRQVMVAGSGLQLGTSGAVGGVELAANADRVTVTIKDANGLVIRTLQLGAQSAGVNDFTWDGTTDAGLAAAPGAYRISVAATQGADTVSATALQLAGVQDINRSSHGVSLNLGPSLGLVTLADIKQIF